MKNLPCFFCGIILFLFQNSIAETTPKESRMMTDPAISEDHISFVYANDLWVADLDGKNVKRLTSNEGRGFLPVFSPDGTSVAYSRYNSDSMQGYICILDIGETQPRMFDYKGNYWIGLYQWSHDRSQLLALFENEENLTRLRRGFCCRVLRATSLIHRSTNLQNRPGKNWP